MIEAEFKLRTTPELEQQHRDEAMVEVLSNVVPVRSQQYITTVSPN